MLTAAAGSASPLPSPCPSLPRSPRRSLARSPARRTLRLRQSAGLSSARRGAGPRPAAGAGSAVPATGRGPGHDGRDGQQGGDGGKDCQQRAEEAHPRAGEGERTAAPAARWTRPPAPIPPRAPALSPLDDRCPGPSEVLGLHARSSERPLRSASSVPSPPPSPHRGGAGEGAAVLLLPLGLLRILAAPLQRSDPRSPRALEVQANCVLEAEGQEDWDELAPPAVQIPAGPAGPRRVESGLRLVPGAALLWESRGCPSARSLGAAGGSRALLSPASISPPAAKGLGFLSRRVPAAWKLCGAELRTPRGLCASGGGGGVVAPAFARRCRLQGRGGRRGKPAPELGKQPAAGGGWSPASRGALVVQETQDWGGGSHRLGILS